MLAARPPVAAAARRHAYTTRSGCCCILPADHFCILLISPPHQLLLYLADPFPPLPLSLLPPVFALMLRSRRSRSPRRRHLTYRRPPRATIEVDIYGSPPPSRATSRLPFDLLARLRPRFFLCLFMVIYARLPARQSSFCVSCVVPISTPSPPPSFAAAPGVSVCLFVSGCQGSLACGRARGALPMEDDAAEPPAAEPPVAEPPAQPAADAAADVDVDDGFDDYTLATPWERCARTTARCMCTSCARMSAYG